MIRTRFNELEKTAAEQDHIVGALKQKVNDLELQLRIVHDDYSNQLQSKDQHISRLNGEISQMVNEYQNLMNAKMQLVLDSNNRSRKPNYTLKQISNGRF